MIALYYLYEFHDQRRVKVVENRISRDLFAPAETGG
jgi:hypothetical protein